MFSQKKSMLDVWQGFQYAPGLLKLLCCGTKNGICQTDCSIHSELKIFQYSDIIHGSTTFKLMKG